MKLSKLIKMISVSYLLFSCVSVSAGELAIIINAKNPANGLTALEIKQLYLKNNTHWGYGKKVRPSGYNYEADIATDFYKEVLSMSDTEVERHWIEVQYGKALKPPVQLDDAAAMMKFVGKFKGAIGFVDPSEVAGNPKVKTLLVVSY